MICNTCNQPFVAKGYINFRHHEDTESQQRIVFECGCPRPWISCWTRQTWRAETGKDVRRKYNLSKRCIERGATFP